MISNKQIRALSVGVLLCILSYAGPILGQDQNADFALQRGYRTGYSDGYMAGYRDSINTAPRDYTPHDEYSRADRAYSREYGSLDDYRDGYKQGFETGYGAGYERLSFEASLPAGLKRRGVLVNDRQTASVGPPAQNVTEPAAQGPPSSDGKQEVDTTPAATITNASYQPGPPIIVIPRETELIIELQNDLNTEQSREGEKFTALVVAPSEINGATIEGRVTKVLKPGRIKRRSELSLAFDRIVLSDSRWSNMSATLIEVMPVKGDNVRRVDNEGTAIGPSSLKSDAVKIGASTGVGAITGAVIAGPVGAAVGAGVGAGFGVGAVVIERGKHVRLNRNQQIRIKTAYETQIR